MALHVDGYLDTGFTDKGLRLIVTMQLAGCEGLWLVRCKML